MELKDFVGQNNILGQDIWHKKYQKNNENFDEWLDRISLHDYETKEEIKLKRFIPGGRILSNVGIEDSGGMSNCYTRGFILDDYSDIMQAAVDIGKTFKQQGGEGLSLTKLRPKGAPIGKHYVSDGIIPFMKIYNEVTEGTSQGGCVVEDQLVLTEQGYKPIKDIQIGDKVYTKKGFKSVLTVWDKGEQITYRTTTTKGYQIETTLDHKFCYDGFNTTSLKNLKIGDKICLITKNPEVNIKKFDEKAYFFAHFLANGYINSKDNVGDITIHKQYKPIADNLINYLTKQGFNAYYRNNTTNENAVRVVLTSQTCTWIKENVFKDNGGNMSVPDWVLQGDDNTILSFLAGAIDSDGTVRKTNFKYNTICKRYAYQIATLMKKVGFFPTISVYIRENKQPLYEVVDSIRKNINIPWSYKINKYNCESVKNSRYRTPYTMENTGLTKNDAKHLGKISKTDTIGLYTYLQAEDKAPFAPMIFDTIEKIEEIGIKHVYDIEVEDEHKFFCEGFYISNSRKGALLMSLNAWHAEIMNFITIKSKDGLIEKANLSLEIDDDFMEYIDLYYKTGEIKTIKRKENYSGHIVEWEITPIEVFKAFVANNWDWGDPGCFFTNRFYNYNIMEFCDNYNVECCNPCGEQPLNKHGACNLGSVNLSEFVKNPYSHDAYFDFNAFKQTVKVGIKYLDKIIDLNANNHALSEQKENSLKFRNCGLGIMGYATMLMKLGLKYGDDSALKITDKIFYMMFRTAVEASVDLAKRYGSFPGYSEAIWDSTIIKNHFNPEEIEQMKKIGLRNCSLLSVAPTGSIASLIGESGGCEPEFAISYTRRTVGLNSNEDKYYTVYCKAAAEYLEQNSNKTLPYYFVSSEDIEPINRIKTQAIMQEHVDTAISSTINLPEQSTKEEMALLYLEAWKQGLKGLTMFRQNCKKVGILTTVKPDTSKKIDETLYRGDIISCSDNLIGRKKKINTGCGSLHILAYFDPNTKDLLEVYLNKGSTGGCSNYMIGLSRMISLLCRAGVSVYDIKDQLDSTGTCSSYAVRAATKHDTAKGSCCPMAIGNVIVEMWEEMQNTNIKQEPIKEQQKKKKNNKVKCPECGEDLNFEGGCNFCRSCGYSKCE